MNKLLFALSAGAMALALSGVNVAADRNQVVPPGSDQAGVSKSQPGADVSAKDQEYLAALKKCEPLKGDQRQKCIDTARKQAGEM